MRSCEIVSATAVVIAAVMFFLLHDIAVTLRELTAAVTLLIRTERERLEQEDA
jgi:hypothetical protein